MARKTSEIVGSLLTRPESRLTPEEPDRSVSATRKRLQETRKRPVELIKSRIDERESFLSGDTGSSSSSGIAIASGAGAAGEESEAEFNRRLQRMMAEAPGGVTIISGKRDPEKQKQLWAEALRKYGDPEIADNWVARPGTSKHETGLAADLRYADDAVKKWYHENAAKYGLSFPMGHEPWHIQYDPNYQSQAASVGSGLVQKSSGRFYTGDSNIDFIIDGESNGIPTAKNPQSSAFGIGQMIRSNRELYGKKFGFDPNTTDPQQQITMMKAYIQDRYGSPEAAAAFKRKHGWY